MGRLSEAGRRGVILPAIDGTSRRGTTGRGGTSDCVVIGLIELERPEAEEVEA